MDSEPITDLRRRRGVIDVHDIRDVSEKVYRAALADLQHKNAAGCRGSPGNCVRGGHVCEVCGDAIWDCAERALRNLEARLDEYGIEGLLGVHCGVCDAVLVAGDCPNTGTLGHDAPT